MVIGGDSEHGKLPRRVHRLRGCPLPGYCVKGKSALQLFLVAVIALVLIPSIANAGEWTGGFPVTTVQTGTVTGDLWFDAMPAPDWGSQNVVKAFTLPAAAVAAPGRITWARLYVSAYAGHMQNDYAFRVTNRWDGDGSSGYELVWPETGHAPFQFMNDGYGGLLGNDNSAFNGHGTNESYKMINDHENRVTSDYLMWYNVKDLITNRTVFVNTETTGSFDGRIKLITLVVAYNDPASTTETTYWVNQGHDALAYYTEDNLGYIDVGNTIFGTGGAGPFTSAILTINHMSSHTGIFGFPSAANDQCYHDAVSCPDSLSITFAETLPDTDRLQSVQGPYSGVIAWDVTSRIPMTADRSSVRRDMTLGYARDLTATGIAAFFKLPLAFLVLKNPRTAAAPVADFTADRSSGTVPFAVQFTDTSNGSPSAWNWTFGDTGAGNTSTLRNPTHTYTSPGTYSVNLSVAGPGGTNFTVKRDYVTVSSATGRPVAAFSASPVSGTAPLSVSFADLSSGSPTVWNWSFGDLGTGNTSTLRNPSHVYPAPGNYTVALKVTNTAGSDVATRTKYVTVTAAPAVSAPIIANHLTTHLSQIPESALDQARSGLHIAYWHTSHGSQITTGMTGLTSFPNAPYGGSTYTYHAGGTGGALDLSEPATTDLGNTNWGKITRTYLAAHPDVNVVMWSWCGQVSEASEAAVHSYLNQMNQLESDYPEVKFVYMTGHLDGSGSQGNLHLRNEQIRAYARANNKILYDFADIESYDPDGVYYGDKHPTDGCNYDYNNDGVTSQNGDPALPANGDHNWAIDWQNNHTRNIDWYSCSAAHTQPLNANRKAYAAWWLWARLAGWDGVSATVTPVAGFTATPVSGASPLTVTFTDTSTGSVTSWAWDFDNDGIVDSTTRNPVYTYTSSGSWTVRLNVSNTYGYDNEVRPGYIAVVADNAVLAVEPPVRMVNASEIQDIRIVLDNAPAGLAGYDLIIRLANPGIAEVTGVTYPSWAQLTKTPLLPNQSVLIGGTDTGHLIEPGATDITLAMIRIRGNLTGMTPVVISEVHPDDDNGDILSPAVSSGTVIVGTYDGPVSAFSANPTSGPADLTVQFTDLSSGSPTSWKWDFDNDGITDSSLKNPLCTYTDPGSYTVNLTVANTKGSHTLLKPGYITVSAGSANAPVASFSANPTSGTVPLVVTFTDTSTGFPESWYWNFGNGQTSVLKTTTITYTSAGVYPVTLNVSNEDGFSSANKYITVNTETGVPGVAFSASPTTGTVPLSVSFTDQSSGSPTSWQWDFDNDGSVDSTTQNPSHTYSISGIYTVTLTATNSKGSDSLTRSNLIAAGSSSTAADLTVKNIVPNLGSVSGGSLFALVQNPVTVNVGNSGTGPSPASSVKLQSNDGFSAMASVPEIAAGSSTTVKITDTTVRQTAGSSITYTATVDPDNRITETNENNNVRTGTSTLKYNGYLGKRYWSGNNDIITRQTYDLHGGLAYSRGDSVYRSGSFGDGGWLSYTVNWQSTEPTIPSGATIRAAYLYVPYTWDNEHIVPDNTFVDFNGQRISRSSWNYDKSNFGVYADYEYGLLKYDVTSPYRKNEENSAVFTRENPKYSDPAEEAVYTKLSMYEMFLVVVYEDSDSTRKQIFINDNFDLLGASSEYGTTPAQATAYVPFTGMTIDTAEMTSATLTTFVPSGDSHEGNLLYNGNVFASNVWDYGGSGTGVDGIPQVAVDTRDVTSRIQATGNTFAIQSTDRGGTPCMAAIQQFLVIDLGESTAPSTTTTATPATTSTTTETLATYHGGPTVTLSSSQGSAGSGGAGSGTSNFGGAGGDQTTNPSSGQQQGGRFQTGAAEGSDRLAGETTANASDAVPEVLPPGLILGCLSLIGASSVIAYRQGGIAGGQPGMHVYWEGPGRNTPCQILDINSGTVQYRNPVFAGRPRTHLILVGIVIAGIVLSGAALSFGLPPFLVSGSSGSLSSDSGEAGNFDLIPTIENIGDLDLTNHEPDYPAGFSARNGLLFVYHGKGTHDLSDLELALSKGANAVTITSTTVPPSVNAVNDRFSTYLEEMGNGDGILDPGEWLMVYADNCYDSSLADGEPKGKVLVWQPQDAGSRVEVPLKDSLGYSLKETADGTILQQGTVMLVPTTP